MPLCKQLIDRQLANWRKSASENGGHFDGWLVLPEMQFMQIGQLESKVTDRLATGNWPKVMAYLCGNSCIKLNRGHHYMITMLLTASFFGSPSRSMRVTVWLTLSDSISAIRPPVRM